MKSVKDDMQFHFGTIESRSTTKRISIWGYTCFQMSYFQHVKDLIQVVCGAG